jgi:hypothetical protein
VHLIAAPTLLGLTPETLDSKSEDDGDETDTETAIVAFPDTSTLQAQSEIKREMWNPFDQVRAKDAEIEQLSSLAWIRISENRYVINLESKTRIIVHPKGMAHF